MKPILLIGLQPGTQEQIGQVAKVLREELPEFQVVVVAGMQYATVLTAPQAEEAAS